MVGTMFSLGGWFMIGLCLGGNRILLELQFNNSLVGHTKDNDPKYT